MSTPIKDCAVILKPLPSIYSPKLNKKLKSPIKSRSVVLKKSPELSKNVRDSPMRPCSVILERDSSSAAKTHKDISSPTRSGSVVRKSQDSKATPELSKDSPVRPCSVILRQFYPNCTPELSKDLKQAIYEKKLLTVRSRKKFMEALDLISSKSKAEYNEKNRNKVKEEIIASEEAYLKQLEKIIEYFINPSIVRNLLKRADLDILFANIRTIYSVNKELLGEMKHNVVNAFVRIAPFLKLYSVYAYDFKKSLLFLQNCRLEHPKFAKFLEEQESRPEVQSKLSALLITPIQRVPRYKLLLQELLTYSDPKDEDYECLKESLCRVMEAADHINTVVEEQENAQRLLELQRYLSSGEPKIIVPGRRLLKDGVLMKARERIGTSIKLYVILTNDIIMFCRMKKEELKVNSLMCSDIYPLNKCKVVEVPDKGCFRVICQNEETVLYSEHVSETKKWITSVKEAVKMCIDDRKTLRKESSVRRPVKGKDTELYNDEGLSPGKPMRKRRISEQAYGETDNFDKKPRLVRSRKPIRESRSQSRSIISVSSISSKRNVNQGVEGTSEIRTLSSVGESSVSVYTERVPYYLNTHENDVYREEDSSDLNLPGNDENREEVLYNSNRLENEMHKELVQYNLKQKSSFTSKVGTFFGGIGTSVKRLFGFR